jgi:spore coat protein U-like protein
LLALWAAITVAAAPDLWTASAFALPPEEEGAAAECKIALVANVIFGNYDPVSGASADTVGQIGVKCAGATIVTIKLGPGNGGGFWPRSMTSGADTLPYNLYQDAARTTVWGDGTSSTSFVTWAPPGGDGYLVFSAYGRIAAGVDASPGVYADKLLVTVDF